MKLMVLTAAAFVAFAGVASAQEKLSSAAAEQVATLAPNLDVATLTPVQIQQLNEEVGSDEGLTRSKLGNIIGVMMAPAK